MSTEPSAADFAGLPRVWRPRASPTGDHVVFFWNPGSHYELFIYDTDTEEQWQVTDGGLHRSPNAPVVWAPSGQTLFIQTGEHGYDLETIFRVDIDGGLDTVAEPGGGWGMLWGVDPTETWLLCTQASDGKTQRLYRYEIEMGERTQLSGPGTEVPARGARIAPDGDLICYPGNATSNPGNSDAYVVDPDDPSPRRLSVDGADSVRTQGWHPDGRHVLLYDEDADRTGEYNLDTEETRWFGSGTPLTYLDGATILTNSPDRVYERATDEATVLDISGRLGDELVAGEVCLDSNRLLVTRETERRSQELYVYDRQTSEGTRVVTTDFGPLDPESFVTAEDVTYESVDGRVVEGLLYRPDTASDETPVPVVVEAHGFPAEAGRGFQPKVQFLVSKGYAVLKPNFRGENDRDEGFAASIQGDWGGAEQADVAAAASWLAEQDWASADRLAIYGHSFGGFTAYTQLVRYPETWTVGIASGGMTDLHSLDAAKGGNELLRDQLGHPREDAALWCDRSPITHVADIERPLFILHGGADPTAPVSQAWAFKGALESVREWTEGEDFEYTEIDEGEHGNLDHETRARQWELVVDFLNRRL